MELVLGEVQSNAKGGKYLPIKGKDGCNNPTFHSAQWAVVVWEPSAFAEGDRVNVCLEATEELRRGGFEMGNCRGGAGNPARRVHVRQAPEPGADAGAVPVVPEDLRAGSKILEAQGHNAQRALLGFGRKAGRGPRQPARAEGPGGGAAAAGLGDEPAVRAGARAAGLQAGRAGGSLPPLRKW